MVKCILRGAEWRGVRFLERVTDMIRHHHERATGAAIPTA